uniref:Vesicle transport protein n=1 Tax=Callithrix jacchus TaxID=9483 RepID=A0A8I3WKF5_CALJA
MPGAPRWAGAWAGRAAVGGCRAPGRASNLASATGCGRGAGAGGDWAAIDRLKKVLSGQDTEDRSGLSEVVEASSLSWGTRIKGFIACFPIGILCSLLGTFLLWVPRKGLHLFAVFYTFGNIASIGSTIFLMGPLKQLKRMDLHLSSAFCSLWH